jgi:hypothetical protein
MSEEDCSKSEDEIEELGKKKPSIKKEMEELIESDSVNFIEDLERKWGDKTDKAEKAEKADKAGSSEIEEVFIASLKRKGNLSAKKMK